MAHRKGQSSSKNGRESHSKRLGIKKFGEEVVKDVGMGKDHTLYALIDGTVKFTRKREDKSFVSVLPFEN